MNSYSDDLLHQDTQDEEDESLTDDDNGGEIDEEEEQYEVLEHVQQHGGVLLEQDEKTFNVSQSQTQSTYNQS